MDMVFKNAINWFEIATVDFDRAVKFYETIFACTLHQMVMGDLKMAGFPIEPGGSGGALVHQPDYYKPSADGALIYLNGNPDLQLVLDRVVAAGGTIINAKKLIAPHIGYMALILDSEGNRIALHSSPDQPS
jgi:uncharacterized protein